MVLSISVAHVLLREASLDSFMSGYHCGHNHDVWLNLKKSRYTVTPAKISAHSYFLYSYLSQDRPASVNDVQEGIRLHKPPPKMKLLDCGGRLGIIPPIA